MTKLVYLHNVINYDKNRTFMFFVDYVVEINGELILQDKRFKTSQEADNFYKNLEARVGHYL